MAPKKGKTKAKAKPAAKVTKAKKTTTKTNQKTTTVKSTAGSKGKKVTPEQRHKMVVDRAFQLAQGRNFENGDPISDWLQAEREVDAILRRK
jgi:hypothetical protein